MKFGGIEKTSLLDFPGKVSCVLFLKGCNFHCPYCHNPQLLQTGAIPPILDDNQVFEFLKSRRGLLDAVVISGGEPTIHGDLAELCAMIKEMDFSVKLDTNGSRPRVLKGLLKNELVDYFAMDVKTEPEAYSPILCQGLNPSELISSIDVIMERAPAYEFRTTCVRPMVNSATMEKMAKTLKGATCYALQHFRNHNVLKPALFTKKESAYTDRELVQLKSIAEPWVKRCVIR
ncbi:MAG: anaerobic ribonucleoside-triphosphate reductase activating protein [Desulfobacteraceae bacterium]|jgi:pyruvate formate lyase activating enzyme|nr:MAG: anaerobic ribonucleoside-triphosphate reductase activating protein [Desulfobacteraceae bacterium]